MRVRLRIETAVRQEFFDATGIKVPEGYRVELDFRVLNEDTERLKARFRRDVRKQFRADGLAEPDDQGIDRLLGLIRDNIAARGVGKVGHISLFSLCADELI